MTTRHRIATAVCASLGLAMSATPALAFPTDITPNGSEVPAGSASVTSRATVPATPPTIVRVTASNGFDWGDAGIGAGGGLALAMVGIGGALALSGRRTRRSNRSPAITS